MKPAPGAHPRHRLTPLMAETFLGCKRRFQIEFEQSLRKANRSEWPWPVSTKAAVREMLAARDRAVCADLSGKEREFIIKRALVDYIDLARQASHPRTPQESTEVEAQLYDLRIEALGIVDHYEHVHRSEVVGDKVRIGRRKVRPVGYQCEFKLPTWSNGKLGRRGCWSYAVSMDRLYLTGDELTLVVRMITSSANRDRKVKELTSAMRWRGHAWAAGQLVGRAVDAIVYDVVRFKAPSIPDTIQCRMCKGEGKATIDQNGQALAGPCKVCAGTGVGGISKARCDTVSWLWERRLAEFPHLVDERARHQDILDRLSRQDDPFAYRITVPVRKGNVETWLHDMAIVTKDIAACRRSGYWPRTPDACADRGRVCPYVAPCSDPERYRGVAYFEKVAFPYPGYAPWI